MTREEKLEAALIWALKEGVIAMLYKGVVSLSDGGCGCCSSDIGAPDDLREIIQSAADKATREGLATETLQESAD